jgi:hypothetical protein
MSDTHTRFIPNSFQTPNAYNDDLMWLLTSPEWKVLSYTARRIFGFQKRHDRISISQYTDGTMSRNGEKLDGGTGLGRETVIKCLEELTKYRVMVKLSDNDPRTNAGAEYALTLDDSIDLAGLLKRLNDKSKADRAKIQAAMTKNNEARSVRQTALPKSVQPTAPSRLDRPTSVGATDTQYPVETQGKPDLAAGDLILHLDLFEAIPSYERLNQAVQEAIKVCCPQCRTDTIGIYDRISPCCHLPIEWQHNQLLADKIKQEEVDTRAKAKRKAKLDSYPPGIRYLVEQARSRKVAELNLQPDMCTDDVTNKEYLELCPYEQRYGEAFIRNLVDELAGDHGRALIKHVVNSLSQVASSFSKSKEGKPDHGNTRPIEQPKLQLTPEARRQLGLE